MRVVLIAMLAAGGIGLLSTSGTSAAPVNNAAIAGAAAATSPVIKARVYCRGHYRHSSRWRFLHWGRC
jgi:hypothetical protein